MSVFEQSVELPTSAESAFAWHERPGALDRLTPPWESVDVVQTSGGIRDGGKATLRLKLGPIPMHWHAEHLGYQRPHKFEDRLVSGPFSQWHHVHSFADVMVDRSKLTDTVNFELPFGQLGDVVGESMVLDKLRAMFAYRHRITRDDLAFHRSIASLPKRIAVTGSSGLVGTNLCSLLTTGGNEVVRLVRRPEDADDVRLWDPSAGTLDPALIADCDAVIHLAGESVMGRWTDAKRKRIRDSRVNSTRLLSETMAALDSGPKSLVVASAMGFYGDRNGERLTEHSAPGDGFLVDVCKEWEAAANPARAAGIRVSQIRLGMVISSEGGALANMLTPFKLCLGGRVGRGVQQWSWIAIDDAAAMFAWAALADHVEGPINGTAPEPLTSGEFTDTLASVVRRPAIVPVPRWGLRAVFGEVADALLLASTGVVPERTLELGYSFRFTSLEETLRHELGLAG